MTARTLFDTAVEAARAWHASLPDTRAFCPWPTDLHWADRAPHPLPAADLLPTQPGATQPAAAPLLAALQALAPHVEWRHTYPADEVGQDFLDAFGWFELAGPHGHFHSTQTRITLGYWGPGLYYPRHQHGPEELYTVVSGTGLFRSDGDADATLGPGGTRFHRAHQPHDMATEDQPIVTLVFWRGAGLDDKPRISPDED